MILFLMHFLFVCPQKGTKAPQAAGKIHTDFEKGFIMAEVCLVNDLYLQSLGTITWITKNFGLVNFGQNVDISDDFRQNIFRTLLALWHKNFVRNWKLSKILVTNIVACFS